MGGHDLRGNLEMLLESARDFMNEIIMLTGDINVFLWGKEEGLASLRAFKYIAMVILVASPCISFQCTMVMKCASMTSSENMFYQSG